MASLEEETAAISDDEIDMEEADELQQKALAPSRETSADAFVNRSQASLVASSPPEASMDSSSSEVAVMGTEQENDFEHE